METPTPISTIMSKNIITITLNENLETAEALFKKHKIKHIPVISNEAIIGIISYTDLMRISFAEIGDEGSNSVDSIVFNMFTIEQVMVKDVVTVTSDTSIKQVAKILAERDFHALPVVNNKSLVGIVTTTDLLNYFIKHI